MPPKLERLSADRIGYFEIPDLFPNFEKTEIFKSGENGDDTGADDKTYGYFLLENI